MAAGKEAKRRTRGGGSGNRRRRAEAAAGGGGGDGGGGTDMAAGAAVVAVPRPRLHRVKTACTATPTTKVTTATEAWASSPRGASEADASSAMPTAQPAPPHKKKKTCAVALR